LNIYRIIQEALNNAEKYSGASLIKVSFYEDGRGLVVEVSDNGKGFDMGSAEKSRLPDGEGYGLQNMKKRAVEMSAEMQIETSPGKGTKVRLHLPVNQPFS